MYRKISDEQAKDNADILERGRRIGALRELLEGILEGFSVSESDIGYMQRYYTDAVNCINDMIKCCNFEAISNPSEIMPYSGPLPEVDDE